MCARAHARRRWGCCCRLTPARVLCGPVPLQLVDEMLTPGAPPEKLMTYEFSTIVIEAQDASLFAVPAPWTHKSCERYIGGFPYLHLFHYYLRV
jgi:hypothetical protein